MKRFAMLLLMGAFAASLRCAAESDCAQIAVQANVSAGRGELTLAHLLEPGTCEPLRRMAAQVRLGSVPAGGSVRVLDGRQIRKMLVELSDASLKPKTTVLILVPERISIRSPGATKSCADFAQFVASAAPAQGMAASSGWQERMDCAAAPKIAQAIQLELTRTSWSAALRRWEFSVRCSLPEDCVPFLLWTREEDTARAALASERSGVTATGAPSLNENSSARLVKRGQTAILTWDQGGIRIVLPVTCLDEGRFGEFVRVQFKSTPRIVRAEVLGDGTLRASL